MRSLLLLPLAAATALAQQVPTRTLAKADVEFGEPFSQITGVRELRDGRLIVSDFREKTLQSIDLGAGRATPIGREGSGPGEFLLPMALFSLPGDSTMLFDIGNTRYLVIGPDAKPVRTFSPAGDAAEAGRAATRGDAAGRGDGRGGAAGRGDGGGRAGAGGSAVGRAGAVIFGGRGAVTLAAPRATDAQGRMYSVGAAFSLSPDGQIVSADSAPIHRYDPRTRQTDTVAYVNLAKNNASGSASGSGGRQEVQIRIGAAGPYAPADDWNVLPDGRIVIARVADYHLEIVQPGGNRVSGRPVAYTPVRVGEAEKEEWRTAQRTGTRVAVSVGDGGRNVSTPPAGQIPEPAAWPAVKPPFGAGGRGGALYIAPNGEIWVMRLRAANDKIPTADVFNAQGRLVGKIVFPESTRLIALGAKGAYLVRIDADDLQYLQRHAIAWTGCPPEIREVCRG